MVKEAPQKQEKSSETSDKDIIADTKRKTKKFEEMVRSFQQNSANENEELKKMKTSGLEMLRLLERLDSMQNVREDLRKKKKDLVTTLNLIMDLNEVNIELLERKLSMKGQGDEGHLDRSTTVGNIQNIAIIVNSVWCHS